ncbi:hypothetical protein C8J57DRAFT_1396864, partial [Mycena rebaudengoi]
KLSLAGCINCFSFAWAPFLRSGRCLTISPSISLLFLAVCICCAFAIILHCSYFCVYSPICFPAPPCSLTLTHSVVSALEYVLASYLVTDWFQ